MVPSLHAEGPDGCDVKKLTLITGWTVGVGVELKPGVGVAVKVGVGVGVVAEIGITLLYPAQSPPTLTMYIKSLPSPTNAAKPLSISVLFTGFKLPLAAFNAGY